MANLSFSDWLNEEESGGLFPISESDRDKQLKVPYNIELPCGCQGELVEDYEIPDDGTWSGRPGRPRFVGYTREALWIRRDGKTGNWFCHKCGTLVKRGAKRKVKN